MVSAHHGVGARIPTRFRLNKSYSSANCSSWPEWAFSRLRGTYTSFTHFKINQNGRRRHLKSHLRSWNARLFRRDWNRSISRAFIALPLRPHFAERGRFVASINQYVGTAPVRQTCPRGRRIKLVARVVTYSDHISEGGFGLLCFFRLITTMLC